MTGVMNWIMPITVRLMRRVPAAKSSSGTAVATPAKASSNACAHPFAPIVMPDVSATMISCATAMGISQNDSRVRPLIASTAGPIFFLMSPYTPKDAVSDSAIHGNCR